MLHHQIYVNGTGIVILVAVDKSLCAAASTPRAVIIPHAEDFAAVDHSTNPIRERALASTCLQPRRVSADACFSMIIGSYAAGSTSGPPAADDDQSGRFNFSQSFNCVDSHVQRVRERDAAAYGAKFGSILLP
jgi:hypothetical protein